MLSAVLNGPVANAYSACAEGLYIPLSVLEAVPVPEFSELSRREIERAVSDYLSAVRAHDVEKAGAILRQIDALVLSAYGLPPRIERKLLDYFSGHGRPVPFQFGNYFPADFEPQFSLADYISEEYRRSTAGELRGRWRPAPDIVVKAMERAVEAYQEE